MAEKKKLGPGRHLSAIKRDRQNKNLNEQNRRFRAEVRSAIKKVRAAVENKDKEQANALFLKAQSLIDHSVKRGLYHRRTGQRNISRLHKQLSQLS